MTALTSNDITVSHNNTTSPLNVALVGVTLIQQMLLEFYFATPEGVQKYTLVLANDAEAYITNFDEENAAEAWQNLHRDENKPTLVLSDHNEIKGHYLYLMTPLTPQGLFEAGCTLKQFSIRSSDKDQLIPASTPLFAEKNSTKGSNLEQVEFISLPDEVVVDSLKSMTEDVLNPNNVVNDVSDDLISFDDLIDSSSSTPPFEDELDYQSIEDMALEEIRVAEKDKSAEKSRLAEAVRL
ncbi:MAG: hypothetical protein KAG28_01735, partial [Cocleimonas sp.]|nr:hypothetical protein [Cocleimonas sp.]